MIYLVYGSSYMYHVQTFDVIAISTMTYCEFNSRLIDI